MIEKILGEDMYQDLFYASMISGLMTEKQAESAICHIEKDAQLKDVLGFLKDIGKGAFGLGVEAVKAIPPAAVWTGAAGAATGTLGALAYDAIKERVTQEDPDTKFNNEIEALYNLREKELEDSKWMSRVIAMRDDLRRNYKKMSTKEYSAKYRALMDALNERAA